MSRYLDMSMWELEQERRKIIKEIERRIILEKRERECLEVFDGPLKSTASPRGDREP